MSIRYICGCGANIRLPHTSAGRKAKCKSCGTIFRIPERADPDAPNSHGKPRPNAAHPASESPRPNMEPGAWLGDLAHGESRAVGEPVVLDLSEPYADEEAGAGPAARAVNEGGTNDHEWIIAPKRSFWSDLATSFVFFLDPGNLATFVTLIVLGVVVNYIPIIGCLGLVISCVVGAYICALLMATVGETAAGEDELPTVWVHNVWDDLVVPILQLAGTGVFVMLPAIALALWSWSSTGKVDMGVFSMSTALHGTGLAQVAALATLLGWFFWPAVVLAVAIGGSFSGLWPHVIIRTALCAPLGYLAICTAILAAELLSTLPNNPRVAAAVGATLPMSGFALSVVGQALWLYSAIVTMRLIGLYYRHYKHRFPWVAE